MTRKADMGAEGEHPWIWDIWGGKKDLYKEFLKGPEKWNPAFKHWVLRFIADDLLDAWLESHDDTDLLRQGAEFMACHAMDEEGDPDVDQMIDKAIERQRAKKETHDT